MATDPSFCKVGQGDFRTASVVCPIKQIPLQFPPLSKREVHQQLITGVVAMLLHVSKNLARRK
jgi:hypothetical protein